MSIQADNDSAEFRDGDVAGVPKSVVLAVTSLFFLSGAAGLVYQVLWMRSLSLFFGSDMYGVSIILSTFMGGLALGSFAGGWWAERTARPLLWYGLAELGIGVFATQFSNLLAALDPWLQSAYPSGGADGGAASAVYQAVRVLVAAGVLLAPTALMGTTFPLIMRHFARAREALGAVAAHFYAINTMGALAGTLAAGFVLLPYLGTTRATWCAAAINLLVGAASASVGLFSARPTTAGKAIADSDSDPLPGLSPEQRRLVATAALVALAVSGFASFAMEVIWTRILLISFSATVYSFASMLACFLFGIFLGSRLIARVVDRDNNPIALFAGLELGVGVSVAVLCVLLHFVPDVFGRLLGAVAATLGGAREHTLVVSTLLASFALLIVPTTLLGATFPVALRAYTTNIARTGSRTGNLYGANTIGGIAGSLTAGLLLIPSLGASASLAAVAVLFTGTGLVLSAVQAAVYGGPRLPRRSAVAAALSLGLAGVSLTIPYRVALNFNQRADSTAELLYHAEGVQNTIDVIRSKSGSTALIIGGNVEADDGYLQRRHFVLKGHLPLMLHEKPRSVLVVGLGMGITLRATSRHPGLDRIDVIELSPEILEAQKQLASVNGDVANDPLVNIRIDDGRVFMKLGKGGYDMITADPIHPKISRVGYLYTKEYYEAIRARLNEGGVVCQWMPIYQIAPSRLRSAVGTFLEVFPEATLWYVENHALLVARKNALSIDYALLASRMLEPTVKEDLDSIDIRSPEELLSHLLMGPAELRAYLDAEPGVPINSDDFPYLEYFVPRDLFYRPVDNTREFVPHLADPADYARNLPRSAAASLEALSDKRAPLLLGDGGS